MFVISFEAKIINRSNDMPTTTTLSIEVQIENEIHQKGKIYSFERFSFTMGTEIYILVKNCVK